MQNGYILDVGDYSDFFDKYQDVAYIDYLDKLLMPGFIDTHVHFPQLEMIASYGDQLLDWLNNYAFPIEKKYSDVDYCKAQAALFMNELINNCKVSPGYGC